MRPPDVCNYFLSIELESTFRNVCMIRGTCSASTACFLFKKDDIWSCCPSNWHLTTVAKKRIQVITSIQTQKFQSWYRSAIRVIDILYVSIVLAGPVAQLVWWRLLTCWQTAGEGSNPPWSTGKAQVWSRPGSRPYGARIKKMYVSIASEVECHALKNL